MDRAMVIRKKVHINVKGSLFCTLVDVQMALSSPVQYHMGCRRWDVSGHAARCPFCSRVGH